MTSALITILIYACLIVGFIRIFEWVFSVTINISNLLVKAIINIIVLAFLIWVGYHIGIALGDLFFS